MQPSDFPMLTRHRTRIALENGRDGDFIFNPTEQEHVSRPEDVQRETEALLKNPTQPGWQKLWILTDESEVVGEITLVNRPPMPAAMHRCLLMMGIERSARGQGWGSKLMHEALGWAKEQPSLEWITLQMLGHNTPAKALYKKFGFEVSGTKPDMFRVFGQSIEETEMVFKLR